MDSIKGKKLNKGEWAEFYVFLKLLGEGRLYTADQLLRKNYKAYLDVIRILRQELETMPVDYTVDSSTGTISIQSKGVELACIPMADFEAAAEHLFDGIKDIPGNSVPAPDDVCDFAKIIYVAKPKAPSVPSLKKQLGGKNDIYIEVRDSQTTLQSIMGFSIKSKFADPATLHNAGQSSQLLFRVSNCDDAKMNEFNSITGKLISKKSGKIGRGWAGCKDYLKEHDMEVEFVKAKNPVYDENMFLVRESMSKILAWCFEDRLISDEKDYGVVETTARMAEANPLGVSAPGVYYEKAIKDFLMASFTGMTPSRKWDGKEQVSGGYIVVTEDGNVLCYHSMDREAFRDYLFKNTQFEYVSSDKYSWSYIEKIGDDYYLPLNASIRFRKGIR